MRQSRGSSPELVSAVPAGFLGTEPLLPLPCPPPLSLRPLNMTRTLVLSGRGRGHLPFLQRFPRPLCSQPLGVVGLVLDGHPSRWPRLPCPSASPVSAPLQQKRARREGARSPEGHCQCLSTHAQLGCGRLGQLGASSFPFLFPVLFFLSLPLTSLEHSRFF